MEIGVKRLSHLRDVELMLVTHVLNHVISPRKSILATSMARSRILAVH
jgi:hypothetical protein